MAAHHIDWLLTAAPLLTLLAAPLDPLNCNDEDSKAGDNLQPDPLLAFFKSSVGHPERTL